MHNYVRNIIKIDTSVLSQLCLLVINVITKMLLKLQLIMALRYFGTDTAVHFFVIFMSNEYNKCG